MKLIQTKYFKLDVGKLTLCLEYFIRKNTVYTGEIMNQHRVNLLFRLQKSPNLANFQKL